MPAAVLELLQVLAALLSNIPEIASGIQTAIDLLTSGSAPTADQQASLDAALATAHAQLQADSGASTTSGGAA
jgi:hypothetical protein